MLHTESVPSGVIPVLKRLMSLPVLQEHTLVGGTALALKYGHRLSVDIDMFSPRSFDHGAVISALKSEFGKALVVEPANNPNWALFCFIEDIKVDLVPYDHRSLEPHTVEEGIRLCAIADIGAMKIQAILSRGKKKDFWDLHELLQHHTLTQLIEWHEAKFPDQLYAIFTPKALIYFTDADKSETPICRKGLKWEDIKANIERVVRNYLS